MRSSGNMVGLIVVVGILLWVYLQRDGDPAFNLGGFGADAAATAWTGFECRIPYAIRSGEIDAAFGMSRADLEGALREAFAVWESYAQRPLFLLTDSPSATPVHLRFDERQAQSDEMAEERRAQEDIVIEIDRMRAELENFRQEFERKRAALQDEVEAYARAVRTYEEWVAAFNRSRSQSQAEQRRLTAEREALAREAQRLQDLQQQHRLDQEHFNRQVEAFNEDVARLNERASAAAAAAAGHGPVGAGRFLRTARGERIDVYLVTSYADLVLTLAHELGHALGIGHVDGEQSIMSAVNIGPSSGRTAVPMLSREDRAALETVCAGRI